MGVEFSEYGLAYLITWTTYGSWLPGDERGWVKEGTIGIQQPNSQLTRFARARMADESVTLDVDQRAIVEATIREHCEFRGWQLHAVNARTNHVHVVVSADCDPNTVMIQFKAWCSRRLNEREKGRTERRWWTKHGSTKWINGTEHLEDAIRYVLEEQ